MVNFLSPNGGLVNVLLQRLGYDSINFMSEIRWFRPLFIGSGIWQTFGFGSIIYLAAITGVDPNLYEAAIVDGANRWSQTWHITLPGMRSIIVLMCVLSLGSVLNAGFDQIFNLYNPLVYDRGDIIDTFVYRLGLIDAQFGPATAA